MKRTQIHSEYSASYKCVLQQGDCSELIKAIPSRSIDLIVTSPPYFMGKSYDKSTDLKDFIDLHKKLLPELLRVIKTNGSICWQLGYYAKDSSIIPLDYIIYNIFTSTGNLFLRNRIIWTFGHGLHSSKRFSGRHEVIMWFSKTNNSFFDLDSVRVPQKYPGKTYYKGKKKGLYSGNPLGKNPSDVWDIPNVKAQHIEKTVHPCQFPVALVQRLVRALTPKRGRVLDPFMGSGSAGVAALLERRKFVGFELSKRYYRIANIRCTDAMKGESNYRPLDKPILVPSSNLAVVRKPDSFA